MKKLFLLLTWLLALPIGMLAQGSTWQAATTLSSGNSGSGTLDGNTIDAWYKIEVTEDGTAELTVTPSGDLNIRILELWWSDENGDIHSRNSSGVGTEAATLTVTDLGKGTYYVLVSRWTGAGEFTLNYKFTPSSYANDAEPNDTYDLGKLLESGKTVQGHLGYRDGTNYTDPDDYYKIEVPSDGTVKLTVTPEAAYGLNIRILELWWCDENGDIHSRNSSGVGTEAATLTVTDVGKGTYYVLVSRWLNHGGYSLKYDFIPSGYENDPELNDTYEKGSLIKSGQTVQGHLGYRDGTNYTDPDDYYKIEVPSDGTVKLTITPEDAYGLDIRILELWWCDENGDIHSRNSSGVGTEAATLTVTDVGKGTYYVLVSRWLNHGGYSLKYDFIPSGYENDQEPNDTYEKGSLIKNGQTVQGHLGYRDGTNYTDPDDYYKIEVPRDGTVSLSITPEKDYDLNIRILELWWCDENGTIHSRNTSGVGTEPATLTVTDVGKGTYYVLVSRWTSHGGYSLKYDFTPNPFAGDEECNDTFDQAKETLYNGQTMKGHIGYRDGNNVTDIDDWFKLEVPDAGVITLSITPEESYGLNLRILELWTLGEDGNVHSLKTSGVGTEPASLSYTLSKGTYYVLVSRWTAHGGYTLHYDFEGLKMKDNEPNDEYTQAVDIANGQSKVGNLGFQKDNGKVDEDDWYKTTVKDGSQLIISYVPDSSESLDVTLVLYYLDNGELKEIRNEWTHLQSKIIETDENLKGGTYYLKVHRNSGTGQYKITIGTPARSLGSDIRVHYTGWPAVRKGVPAPFTVTVENISSEPSCSFWLSMSYTDDIKLLYAELPTPNGTQHLDISDMGDEQYHNALLLFPGLRPYEKYSFNVWAEGYVEGKYDARGEKKIIGTATTLLVVGAITGIVTSMAKDRVEDLMQDYTYKYVQDKETAERYNRAYGTTMEDIKLKRDKYDIMAHGMTTVAQQVGEKVAGMVPGGATAASVAQAVGTVKKFADPVRRRFMVKYGRAAYLDELMDEILDEKPCVNNTVSSFDPNEMVGPAGHGDENYIGETQTINYRILFENKAEATAPAYRIRISDVLDENVFDVSSVRFGGTSHDNAGFGWKMNRDGNKLSWDIEGIELPPNKTAPEGEGYVDFSVDLKPGLANKAKISNKATIIFDYNDPIETNVYVNTLDLVAPITKMVSATTGGGKVVVSCSGSDDESGVGHYKFFVSENGGDFEQFADKYEPQVTFDIPAGGKAENYKFYAVAIDNVGNVQTTPPDAIAPSAGTAGDANGDGTINAADIVEVVNYIMGSPSDKFNAANADANGDGTVNAADIVTIVNIIMGN